MENHQLLKTQKNEVFQILQKAGLEPANFSWDISSPTVQGWTFPQLNYLEGRYYFVFALSFCILSPGIVELAVEHHNATSWNDRLRFFARWVQSLKKELEVPDLWAEMEKYKLSFSVTLPKRQVNEPISASEAEKISDKLSLLTNTIEQQFDLDAEHKKFVRSKLNYLAEAAKRQSSLDWVHTLIGVSVTIVLSLNLTPDKASDLWRLIKSVLSPFIHLIGP
jgi:hypothetical protein